MYCSALAIPLLTAFWLDVMRSSFSYIVSISLVRTTSFDILSAERIRDRMFLASEGSATDISPIFFYILRNGESLGLGPVAHFCQTN